MLYKSKYGDIRITSSSYSPTSSGSSAGLDIDEASIEIPSLITKKEVEDIAYTLKNKVRLEYLSLNVCKVSYKKLSIIMEALPDSFIKNITIISRPKLEKEKITLIFQTLKSCNKIESIHLSGFFPYFTKDSINDLPESAWIVEENIDKTLLLKIKTLALGYLNIKAKDIKYINQALFETGITALYLNENSIGKKEATGLKDILSNPKIKVFDISDNEICDKDLNVIAEALNSDNTKITHLHIARIDASSTALKNLINNIKNNKSLVCLGGMFTSDAYNNEVRDAVIELIETNNNIIALPNFERLNIYTNNKLVTALGKSKIITPVDCYLPPDNRINVTQDNAFNFINKCIGLSQRKQLQTKNDIYTFLTQLILIKEEKLDIRLCDSNISDKLSKFFNANPGGISLNKLERIANERLSIVEDLFRLRGVYKTSKVESSNNGHFMRLPPELRKIIYSYLSSDDIVLNKPQPPQAPLPVPPVTHSPIKNMSYIIPVVTTAAIALLMPANISASVSIPAAVLITTTATLIYEYCYKTAQERS